METHSHSRSSVTGVAAELQRRNRLLCTVALLNAVLALAFTILMQLDGRMLLGRNVWTKPWKFAVSISIFAATMAWLLPSLSLGKRLQRRVSTIIGAAMLIEITLISIQAARGVRSHFNTSTVLDGTVAAVMGITISVNTVVVGYVLWRTLRDPPSLAPAYRWGIWLGLSLFLLASLEGALMVVYGSHSVGVAPDSAGLPLLNWHYEGGDLRIAHFIGLHGLQILPLAGYLGARRTDRTRRALTIVGVVALLYGGLTAVTFVRAMLGLPFLAPVPTAPALGGLVAAVLLPCCGLVAVKR
ncbi:hypothetical protein [Halovenus sp. HT40]|uniref:hypothetical protein n=1 Tax=Halovenus sp. HT40 TaxID=3126691 RepID=UPI00300F411A